MSLGYFLERSKTNNGQPLEETILFRPRMLKINMQLHNVVQSNEIEFSVIRTDIRSMCFLEGSQKLVIELNGENLQILLFFIQNKTLFKVHQEVDNTLGIKSISDKINGYILKYCEERGISNDNEVKTKNYVDNLVHSYFVLEHFEQSEYKNIRIRDMVTGKIHNYKIYLNTIKRLYKQYIKRVEEKIKTQLKNLFFQSLMEMIEMKIRLVRPLEEITLSDMSCNLSKNEKIRPQMQNFNASKFTGPSKDSIYKNELNKSNKRRLSITNKVDSKFLSKVTRDRTPSKRTSFMKSKVNKSAIKRVSKVFGTKEELVNSKYIKGFRKKFASTVKGLPSFNNGSMVNNMNESVRDTSISKGKSQLNSSRNKSKVFFL
jgi:hypothetical protein